LPNWKLAKPYCANLGNIKPVMAQASTSFANLARSTTTTQILMIGASIGLHFLVANNLSWFGRLDPIKLKPAGGTVKVVDLTPAEQTRVPEAVKSNPLPIAPAQQNPEPATRSPGSSLSSGNPGTSIIPPNRTPLPPPSSQIPRTPNSRQPTQSPSVQNPPTNSTSKREIPIVPKPQRSSSQDTEGRDNTDRGNGTEGSKTRKRSGDTDLIPDTSGNNNTDPGTKPIKPSKTPDPEPKPKPKPKNELAQMQQQFNQDIKDLEKSLGGSENFKERPINPMNKGYPAAINKCSREQNGYILFAILLLKDGDVKITPARTSSFLTDKRLLERAYDDAFTMIKGEPVDPDKNIRYKFKFEYAANSCQA
jgi:hypothetical protein